MVFSSDRKLALSGWLQHSGRDEYMKPLKLQKFLFFYEAMSKTEGDEYDFSGLQGWRRGSVFSAVWGDYTKNSYEFSAAADTKYIQLGDKIQPERAVLCGFIARVFNEEDLIEITHAMNIWNSKKERIERGERGVELDEGDFSSHDREIVNSLKKAFPPEFVASTRVLHYGSKQFLFPEEDVGSLSEEHDDVLWQLAQSESLENPVYAHIENGVIVID